MDKNEILIELFSGKNQLPTLPVLFNKLNQMLANPMTSNKKIAELIMKDQSMTIKLLKLCNSAMYSKRQEITDLANAITFLGLNQLKTLVLQISLVKIFPFSCDDSIPHFSINSFWEHSLGTAYFSNIIVKKLNLEADDSYYISGLLHDIGKLVIYQHYPEEFKEIITKQIKNNLIDIQAEEEILGVNHNEIGAFLAESWNFAPEITNVIRSHHDTGFEQDILVAVVQLANLFSKAAGLCFPWDSKFFEIMGAPGWEVISNHAKEIDIDALVTEIMEESQSVKDSVAELLSGK